MKSQDKKKHHDVESPQDLELELIVDENDNGTLPIPEIVDEEEEKPGGGSLPLPETSDDEEEKPTGEGALPQTETSDPIEEKPIKNLPKD